MVSGGGDNEGRLRQARDGDVLGGDRKVRAFSLVLLVVALLVSPAACLLGLAGAGDDAIADTRNYHDQTAYALGTGSPPLFYITPTPDPLKLEKDQVWTFMIYVADPDGDPLHVVWDWGDGTVSVDDTGPSLPYVMLMQSHAWSPDVPGVGVGGDYGVYIPFTLNISLNDGNGNEVWDLTSILIIMPENGYPSLNITIPYARVDPTDVVTIVANASDPEGEALTWTFTFNNGTEDYHVEVYHTPPTAPNQVVWNNITHVFGAVGRYKVTLNVSDAPVPYQVYPHNLSKEATIDVVVNLAPQVLAVINANPHEPIITSEKGFVLVNYSVEAADPDGDILTVTWDFGDGTPPVVNRSAGGTGKYVFVQVRNYTNGGVFNITVHVTDGRAGHDVLLYRTMWVNSTNKPPSIVLFDFRLSGGNYARPNETINFTLVIMDPESDPIEVFIDWGDGTPLEHLVLSEFVNRNATVLLQHSYAAVGNYTINITYTDNKVGLFKHNKSIESSIWVYVPPPVVIERWSWWDYTSLGLFCMIPVLIAARAIQVARRRKRLEEEGMTLEEWKLIKSELQDKSRGPPEGR